MNREFLATILHAAVNPVRPSDPTSDGGSGDAATAPTDALDYSSDISVAVEPGDDGSYSARVAGREFRVDAARVRPGTWSLIIDGRSLIVDLDERRTGTALVHGRNEFTVDLDDAQRKRLARAMAKSGAAGGRGEIVRAPIAGKVVKLLVDDGDEVAVGQGVAVLEAMKMENEIKAERGGQVSAVHVSEGQSVETNDKLLTLS